MHAATAQACAWLAVYLEDEPKPAAELFAHAAREGHRRTEVVKAMRLLGIVRRSARGTERRPSYWTAGGLIAWPEPVVSDDDRAVLAVAAR